MHARTAERGLLGQVCRFQAQDRRLLHVARAEILILRGFLRGKYWQFCPNQPVVGRSAGDGIRDRFLMHLTCEKPLFQAIKCRYGREIGPFYAGFRAGNFRAQFYNPIGLRPLEFELPPPPLPAGKNGILAPLVLGWSEVCFCRRGETWGVWVRFKIDGTGVNLTVGAFLDCP